MGRGLQVLLNALIILHLGGHWDGHRGTTPTDAEGTGPTVGEGRSWEMRLENQATYPPTNKSPIPMHPAAASLPPCSLPPTSTLNKPGTHNESQGELDKSSWLPWWCQSRTARASVQTLTLNPKGSPHQQPVLLTQRG